MARRKRDIFKQDRIDLRKGRMARAQAAMTVEEADELLVNAIVENMIANGDVKKQDLRRTNVRPDIIEARFKHCLAIAEERCPSLRGMRSEIA